MNLTKPASRGIGVGSAVAYGFGALTHMALEQKRWAHVFSERLLIPSKNQLDNRNRVCA